MRNRTTEHIDMNALSDKISTALIQSGKFRFVDAQSRRDIAEEYEYHQSGYVDPAQAKAPGSQTGSDFLLTDLVTSEIIWTDEKKIRKAFKKRSIGL